MQVKIIFLRRNRVSKYKTLIVSHLNAHGPSSGHPWGLHFIIRRGDAGAQPRDHVLPGHPGPDLARPQGAVPVLHAVPEEGAVRVGRAEGLAQLQGLHVLHLGNVVLPAPVAGVVLETI